MLAVEQKKAPAEGIRRGIQVVHAEVRGCGLHHGRTWQKAGAFGWILPTANAPGQQSFLRCASFP